MSRPLWPGVLVVLLSCFWGGVGGSGPSYNVTLVADNFNWVENLVFAGDSLYATDLRRGEVWRLDVTAENPLAYNKTLWSSGFFDTVLGLAHTPKQPHIVYAVGTLENGNVNVVAAVSLLEPQNVTVVAKIPKVGNGLGVHDVTGLIYTSALGDFLPGGGAVYGVNPNTGHVSTLKNGIWAPDGLWVDQLRSLLYVGQLVEAHVLVWNLTTGALINILPALSGVGALLDDITLDKSGALWGCDRTYNAIVQFPAQPYTISPGGQQSSSVPIVTHTIKSPTSVRWGTGLFNSDSLYISEGEIAITPKDNNTGKVWRVDFF